MVKTYVCGQWWYMAVKHGSLAKDEETVSNMDVIIENSFKVSWTEKVNNEATLDVMENSPKLLRKRQVQFLGQVMRREKLENFCFDWKKYCTAGKS